MSSSAMRSAVVECVTSMESSTSNVPAGQADPSIVAVVALATPPVNRTLDDFGHLGNVDGRDVRHMLADWKILSI